MLSKNIKATLLCGPKELSASFMFEVATYWAEKGRNVVYIMPEPLERWPAACHDRSNPAVGTLKLMRFMQVSKKCMIFQNNEEEHLNIIGRFNKSIYACTGRCLVYRYIPITLCSYIPVHLYQTYYFAKVINKYLSNYDILAEQLIKLHTYAAIPSVLLIDDIDNYLHDNTIGNDSSMHIAKTYALILHSMKSCSRVLKTNVYVCAWTNSIFTNNSIQTIYFHNIWKLTEEQEEGKKIILLEKVSARSTSEQLYKYYKFQDGTRVLKQILGD